MRAAAWWLMAVLTWLASLTTVSWQELTIAALAAIPCAVAARRLARSRAVHAWRVQLIQKH